MDGPDEREEAIFQAALKVIKLCVSTKQVIARFEAVRQALALMDHPNIAKVLDAGAQSAWGIEGLTRQQVTTNWTHELACASRPLARFHAHRAAGGHRH